MNLLVTAEVPGLAGKESWHPLYYCAHGAHRDPKKISGSSYPAGPILFLGVLD